MKVRCEGARLQGGGRTICKSIVSNVVPRAVKEDEEHHSNTRRSVGCLCAESVHCVFHSHCPSDIDEQHSSCTSQEHRSSLESWWNKSNHSTVHETPGRISQINHWFGVGIRNSNHVQNLAEVETSKCQKTFQVIYYKIYLRDQGIATPLCEQSHGCRDQGTSSHSWSGDHVSPRLFTGISLQDDDSLNLSDFCSGEYRFLVTFGMVFDQNIESFFASIFRNQPTIMELAYILAECRDFSMNLSPEGKVSPEHQVLEL